MAMLSLSDCLKLMLRGGKQGLKVVILRATSPHLLKTTSIFEKVMSGFGGLNLHHVSLKTPSRGYSPDMGYSTLSKSRGQKNTKWLPQSFTFSKTTVTYETS